MIDPLAARQNGVFTRRQALVNGLSERQIQRRLDRGTWVRLGSGVYGVASAPPTWGRQLWAAYLSRPEALVAGRSAAYLHGFTGMRQSKPEILIPFAGNARSSLARVIRSRHYDVIEYKVVKGMETTSIAETILTLGYTNPGTSIERWVDDLMAANRLNPNEFDPIFARLTNARVRGLGTLRRVVLTRDHDAYQPPTSELERMLYRLLDRDELAQYTRQLPINFGRLDATVDAYIDDWRLIVEGDGRRWHTRKADFDRDRARDNAAAAKGIQVIRFTYRMLKSDPDGCVNTLLNTGRWR